MDQSSIERGNTLFGTFQIIVGAFLVWNGLAKEHWSWIELLPIGIGIWSIVYGILRIMGRIKATRQEPWQFALMIGLFLGVIVLAYFTRPKNSGESVKHLPAT